MTARERVIVLQRWLLTAVVLRALLIGASVALLVIAVARLLGLSPQVTALVATTGLFVAVLIVRRGLSARSLERVALWVEERHPALRYALVTATEAPASPEVERQALAAPWFDVERRGLLRALLAPGAVLVVVLLLFALVPSAATSSASLRGNLSAGHSRRGALTGSR